MIKILGKELDLVTVDFETYYSDEYTLSGKNGLPMSEYIRDPRFKMHGCGIKINDGKYEWLSDSELRTRLASLDRNKTAILGQNTAFDGLILTHHYNFVPEFYFDTMSMSKPVFGHHVRHNLDAIAKRFGLKGKIKRDNLHNTKNKRDLDIATLTALGEYCKDDIEDTYAIFWKMYDFIPDNELRLIDLTIRMFADPVLLINEALVQGKLEDEINDKKKKLELAQVDAKQVSSPKKFAELLIGLGVEPPMKTSPATGKPTYAFAKNDQGLKDLLLHPDQRVRALVDARIRIKSNQGETRARRFLAAGSEGKLFPMPLTYAAAHTYRWGGMDKKNVQNLERGGALRRSIMAPKGYVLVVADSAQIEARYLAYTAGQTDLVNAFKNKEDPYKLMASALFGKPVELINKDERFVGKTCVLALQYQMGGKKLRDRMWIEGKEFELEECLKYVHIYRRKNNYIVQFWHKAERAIQDMIVGKPGEIGPCTYDNKRVRLPNGLYLHYPELTASIGYDWYGNEVLGDATYKTLNGMTKIYGGLFTENLNQALTRCIIAHQMLMMVDNGLRIMSMSHDEIVTLSKERDADKTLDLMIDIMRTPPDWAKGAPLDAEGGYDICYSK